MGPAIEWVEGVNFGLLNFHDSSVVGGPSVLSWNYPLLWTGFYIQGDFFDWSHPCWVGPVPKNWKFSHLAVGSVNFHFFGRDFAILNTFRGGTSQKITLYIFINCDDIAKWQIIFSWFGRRYHLLLPWWQEKEQVNTSCFTTCHLICCQPVRLFRLFWVKPPLPKY